MGFTKVRVSFHNLVLSEGEYIRGFINLDMVVPNERPKCKVLNLDACDDSTLDVDHQSRIIRIYN